MPSETSTPDIDRLRELEPRFLLVKRDLYYRPDNCGYTGIKDRAGRYHASEADRKSGVTAIHEDDAPMFSKGCWDDVKVQHLLGIIDSERADRAADKARIAELEALARGVKNILPIGDASKPDSAVFPIYVRMSELRALHEIAARSALNAHAEGASPSKETAA